MTKPNESAFAIPASGGSGHQDGLTKREYFAAMAMQGLIPYYVSRIEELKNTSQAAVDFADALIKELNATAHETVEEEK